MEVLCWQEAGRADAIAAAFCQISTDQDMQAFGGEVVDITREVQMSSSLLRDLCDLFLIYRIRAPSIRESLAILLPCFGRTLNDIQYYLGDRKLLFSARWLNLCRALTAEAGMSLPERFRMYNDYIVQMIRFLSRSGAQPYVISQRLNVTGRPNLYDQNVVQRAMAIMLRLRGRIPGLPGNFDRSCWPSAACLNMMRSSPFFFYRSAPRLPSTLISLRPEVRMIELV